MLCDQLANITLDDVRRWHAEKETLQPGIAEFTYNGLRSLRPLIQRAHKFILDDDVTLAAEAIRVSKPSSIEAAIEYARLPFDTVWIEWNHNSVYGHQQLEPGTYRLSRAGILVEAMRNYIGGRAHLCWSLHDSSALRVSECSTMFDFSGEFTREIRKTVAPETANMTVEEFRELFLSRHPGHKLAKSEKEMEALMKSHYSGFLIPSDLVCGDIFKEVCSDPKKGVQLVQSCQDDWRGELDFLKAVLILMNCHNAIGQKQSEPTPRLNKHRVRAGKLPLFEHRIIHMKLRGPEKRADPAGGEHASPRAHLVRGHFKVRKTGVYFWSPFVRGNTDLGSIRSRHHVHKE